MIIKELKIYTSNLEDQLRFYHNVLRLKLVESNQESASISIGSSLLTLEYRSSSLPYHFAFNIPAFSENEALEWLKSRVSVMKYENEEIHDFDFWNAKAIYFYDADSNIVEFIARRNLQNPSKTKFGSDSMLNISEIGIPTLDIKREFDLLNEQTGIDIYSGSYDRFCAVGDEEGLFIFINKQVKDWYPNNDKAYSADFKLRWMQSGSAYDLDYQNQKIYLKKLL